ncbi:extracellular metalloprotease [Xylaria sp. FL0043]|nr:extracellular metalloprotease [Xylaria sp. FL0043]
MSGNVRILPPHNKKSHLTGDQVEAATTTAKTPVYFWYLDKHTPEKKDGEILVDDKTTSKPPRYSQSMSSVHQSTKTEFVVNAVDGRTPVDPKDYQTVDGQFRAIVKLFLYYQGHLKNGLGEDQATWAMATGWLVSEDVVVTAGHCVYNYSHNLGELVKVKAYVGYNGKESISKSDVAFRRGIAVATTEGWMTTAYGDERRDVSFIKLESPFKKNEVAKYYVWDQTPISNPAAELGVVGYPGDIINNQGERGAAMYKMFKTTQYDLESAHNNMLQYRIDTYGGNSGSPVFQDSTSLTAIGVHVLGGSGYNSASVISGTYGNRFLAYFNIARELDGGFPSGCQQDKDRPWLMTYNIETTESVEDDPEKAALNITISKAETVHSRIPGKIIDFGSPISFGEDAGPQVGCLAAAAIAAAGRLAADSVHGSRVETLVNTRPYDGILERAILAESALQTYFFDLSTNRRTEVKEFMGPVVAALAPFVLKVAPRLLKGILEPSTRLLLSNISPPSGSDNVKRDSRGAAEIDTGFGRKLTDAEAGFLKGLTDELATQIADDRESSAVEAFRITPLTIGDVLGNALKKVGPVLVDVARIGLPLLLGTETGGLPAPETNLDALAHRAILAEACLQAYMALPASSQKRVYTKLLKRLQVLGPKLLRVAPLVAGFMGPVVADILRERDNKQKHQEFLDFTWG